MTDGMAAYDLARKYYGYRRRFVWEHGGAWERGGDRIMVSWDKLSTDERKPWIYAAAQTLIDLEV